MAAKPSVQARVLAVLLLSSLALWGCESRKQAQAPANPAAEPKVEPPAQPNVESNREPVPPPADIAGCDMSNDATVMAIYAQLSNGNPANPHCIRRSAAFPRLAYAAMFVDDGGCFEQKMIVDCREGSEETDVASLLESAGWSTTDDAGRAKIARDWLSLGHKVLWTADALATRHFAAAGQTFKPAVVEARDGAIRIEGWFRTDQAGIDPYHHYGPFIALFAKDGTLTRSKGAGEPFEPRD